MASRIIFSASRIIVKRSFPVSQVVLTRAKRVAIGFTSMP